MPALTPGTALRYGVYAVIGLLLAVGVWSLRSPAPADNPAYAALSKALTRRITADSLALDSTQVALRHALNRVQPSLVRYRTARDTVLQHLTDTVLVKQYVARSDSVVRSCTELAESCERFRVRADSSLASLTLDRDRWRVQAESERPSGFSLFVRRTLPVVAFVGGVYVGSRVVR